MIPNNKISTYDSYLQTMDNSKRSHKILNLSSSFKFKPFLSNTISPSLAPTPSPTSILFSNRMKKYKEEHDLLPIKVCLDDNVEWEIPAFVIVSDTSILGHKRIYSSIEKKLKMDDQDNIVYNMLSAPSNPTTLSHQLKREFSIVYEPCTVIINTESIKFNRLSYAKIADYCSLNYPKSVKKAYKQLLILWIKHIQEYPEYWEGFDVNHMKRIYKNELNNEDFEDEDSTSEYAYHSS